MKDVKGKKDSKKEKVDDAPPRNYNIKTQKQRETLEESYMMFRLMRRTKDENANMARATGLDTATVKSWMAFRKRSDPGAKRTTRKKKTLDETSKDSSSSSSSESESDSGTEHTQSSPASFSSEHKSVASELRQQSHTLNLSQKEEDEEEEEESQSENEDEDEEEEDDDSEDEDVNQTYEDTLVCSQLG